VATFNGRPALPMQMRSISPTIPVSGPAQISTRVLRIPAGRSITLEGIAVRASIILRISVLVLLLISTLAD
jgi:hypothetical protein